MRGLGTSKGRESGREGAREAGKETLASIAERPSSAPEGAGVQAPDAAKSGKEPNRYDTRKGNLTRFGAQALLRERDARELGGKPVSAGQFKETVLEKGRDGVNTRVTIHHDQKTGETYLHRTPPAGSAEKETWFKLEPKTKAEAKAVEAKEEKPAERSATPASAATAAATTTTATTTTKDKPPLVSRLLGVRSEVRDAAKDIRTEAARGDVHQIAEKMKAADKNLGQLSLAERWILNGAMGKGIRTVNQQIERRAALGNGKTTRMAIGAGDAIARFMTPGERMDFESAQAAAVKHFIAHADSAGERFHLEGQRQNIVEAQTLANASNDPSSDRKVQRAIKRYGQNALDGAREFASAEAYGGQQYEATLYALGHAEQAASLAGKPVLSARTENKLLGQAARSAQKEIIRSAKVLQRDGYEGERAGKDPTFEVAELLYHAELMQDRMVYHGVAKEGSQAREGRFRQDRIFQDLRTEINAVREVKESAAAQSPGLQPLAPVGAATAGAFRESPSAARATP